jgi:hypothetical protein
VKATERNRTADLIITRMSGVRSLQAVRECFLILRAEKMAFTGGVGSPFFICVKCKI